MSGLKVVPDEVPVFMVAAVHGGLLYLAPLGSTYDLSSPVWRVAGPAPASTADPREVTLGWQSDGEQR